MDIIIVGAGIAGLSAGIGLRRAGHNVTILEQSSLLHEVGAAVTLKPNAGRVLASWAFDPAKSAMTVLGGVRGIDGASMQTTVSTPYEGYEARWGHPVYSVHRVDLHTQLRDLATGDNDGVKGRPCEVRVRAKVVDYGEAAARGRVTTEGGEVLRADLVVAADGVHSAAVRHVLGDGDGDEQEGVGDTGWACMWWMVPTDELLADPATAPLVEEPAVRYFGAAGGAAGLVWYPCRNNEVQNFLYLSQEFDTSRVGKGFRGHVEPDVPLQYARKQGFSPALHPVFGKARDVKFWKLVAREPIPKWHKGRLVLIGDAAHPMLTFQALGTGQAVEDGAALGTLLDHLVQHPVCREDHQPLSDSSITSQSIEELEGRLRLFEQVRRGRASALQVLSQTNPPLPASVRASAAAYLPPKKKEEDGTTTTRWTLDSMEEIEDMNEYVYGFDVVAECEAALRKDGVLLERS